MLEKRMLGKGGPIVSRLGLGTMTFGVETDEKGSARQMDMYVEAGGNFIDTADAYAGGETEAIIGRWLDGRSDRESLILATKCRFAPPEGSAGASRRGIKLAVERSLKRMKTDYIDLHYIHGWDQDTPVEQTLEALAELMQQGKIHTVGWSNVTAWQLQKIIDTAKHGGFPVPVTLQPQYSLLDRGIETEIYPCCLAEGLSVTPWSPLGGGWLTGKYSRDRRPEGSTRLGENPERGVEAYDIRNNDKTYDILDVVKDIANRHNRPMAHVALAWLLQRPRVDSILLGARTIEQLETNLAAADLVLTDAEMNALTAVSAPGLPAYPYQMLEQYCGLTVWDRLGAK